MSICPIIDGTIPTRQNGKTLPCANLVVENEKLRELVRGLEVCADEDADARTDCPLYDEGEPDRCAKERIKRELGIEVDA